MHCTMYCSIHYTVQYAIHFALHYTLHYALHNALHSTLHYSLHNQCISNNCWRSIPLPCGQYMAIFITMIMTITMMMMTVTMIAIWIPQVEKLWPGAVFGWWQGQLACLGESSPTRRMIFRWRLPHDYIPTEIFISKPTTTKDQIQWMLPHDKFVEVCLRPDWWGGGELEAWSIRKMVALEGGRARVHTVEGEHWSCNGHPQVGNMMMNKTECKIEQWGNFLKLDWQSWVNDVSTWKKSKYYRIF